MSKRFEFVSAPQRSPEWFEMRKGGITATGITAINGTSPYKTAYRLWAELTGQVGEQEVGAAAQRGQLLEQAVADYYTAETGKKLRKSNGIVRLKLYKGGVHVVGRKSDDTLFDATIATFEDDKGAYNQKDAEGFIRLNALRLRVLAKRNRRAE